MICKHHPHLRFTSIVSDTVGEFTVLYIGTNAGTVEKLVITPDFQLVLATEFVVAVSKEPYFRFC